ncbi:type II secretion system protein GspL [Deltaproteobacteria bacterium]|nr:type II secretion system protein GspL [Deltaproteobacteria bacterium]
MPGKILGLDIGEDFIAAVQVMSGLKGYQILSCFRILFGEKGLDGALSELSQKMDLKSDNCLVSIPVGDISYRNLRMPFKEPKKIKQTLPFEIETVIPFPIEDMVVDFNIVDRSDQREILAVAAKKAHISKYLSSLRTVGIDPDIIDVGPVPTALWLLGQEGGSENGLLLDTGLNKNSMILFLNGRIALIRTFAFDDGVSPPTVSDDQDYIIPVNPTAEQMESRLKIFCASVQNTIHSFSWQIKRKINLDKIFFSGVGLLYPDTGELLNRFLGSPVEQVNIKGDKSVRMDFNMDRVWTPAFMNNALALGLREVKKGRGFNLRKGEFETSKSYFGPKKEIRKTAALLILVFLFLSFDLGADYYSLNKRYEISEQRINTLFSMTFPEVTRIVDPVNQFRIKIEELKNSAGFLPGGIDSDRKVLDLLRDISGRIPQSFDIDITNMVIDAETVRITGETDTFNTVNNLKSRMEPSVYFESVTISSANLDRTGKRVDFEIKMQRAE